MDNLIFESVVSLSVIETLDASFLGVLEPVFLESLILAQDERWRRA